MGVLLNVAQVEVSGQVMIETADTVFGLYIALARTLGLVLRTVWLRRQKPFLALSNLLGEWSFEAANSLALDVHFYVLPRCLQLVRFLQQLVASFKLFPPGPIGLLSLSSLHI